MKLSTNDAREIYRHRYILRQIGKAKEFERDNILRRSPAALYKCIKSLCRSLVDGRIRLTNKHRTTLAPHHELIRELARGTNKTIKSQALMSGNGLGSFLKSVVPIVLPILAALL